MSEFKAGQRVRVSVGAMRTGGIARSKAAGQVATVRLDGLDQDGDVVLLTKYGKVAWAMPEYVTLVGTEFAVGDRVRVIDTGDTGTVTGVDDSLVITTGRSFIKVDWDNGTSCGLFNYRLEKIEEDTLSVGDRVRILPTPEDTDDIEVPTDWIGLEGEVTSIDTDTSFPVRVVLDDRNYPERFKFSEVERIEEQNNDTEEDEPTTTGNPCQVVPGAANCPLCPPAEDNGTGDEEPTFKPGDKVRIVSSPDGISGIEVPPAWIGRVGTVIEHHANGDTVVEHSDGIRSVFEPGEVEPVEDTGDEGTEEQVKTALQTGDRVRIIAGIEGQGRVGTIVSNPDDIFPYRVEGVGHMGFVAVQEHEVEKVEDEAGEPVDAVNHPPYYKFSNDAQVIDITEHLTFNGGNAVKYVVRSTRQDGQNKGNVLEDLRKARWYIDREIERIEDENA